MTQLTHTQLIAINLPDFETNVLVYICQRSNSLFNQGHYYVKRNHEMTHPGFLPNVSYEQMYNELKASPNYTQLCAQAAQQTLRSVEEAYTSYKGLMQKWWRGEVKDKPKQPRYRKKGGLYPVSYPAQAVTFYYDKPVVRIPLGNELKEQTGISELLLPCPYGIKPEQVIEVSIVPRNGVFYAAYVYKVEQVTYNLDPSRVLGIDPNTKNWLACVSNIGKSFILDGGRVRFWNQKRNKVIAQIKQGKDERYWDEECQQTEETRNRRMRDAINKTARFVVNWCIRHNVGTIIFGWNQGNKDSINLGKRNNQGFVQIPTARLKKRIEQLAKEVGIQFIETEESYTSKASFLDGDEIPTYGAKPEGWNPSGKRVKRGLYQTKSGYLVNADLNGAANILRKVSIQLGLELDLTKVCRQILTLPARYDVFQSLKKRYRIKCEAASLQSAA